MQGRHPFSAQRSLEMQRETGGGRETHVEDQDAPEYATNGL